MATFREELSPSRSSCFSCSEILTIICKYPVRCTYTNHRGVMVWERGGTPFRQIFRSRDDQFIFWPKLPPSADLASKTPKKFSGEGATPSCIHSPCAGAQAPPLLGPRSRKPFPQIKIYHYTLDKHTTHAHTSQTPMQSNVQTTKQEEGWLTHLGGCLQW